MKFTHILSLSFLRDGQEVTVHPVVVGGELLVDCGFPGQLPALEAALGEAGLSPAGLRTIMATHHDWDHVGCLASLKCAWPQLQVAASADDAARLEGREKSRRLVQAENLQADLPPEQQEAGRRFMAALSAVEPVRVDRILKDGEIVGPGGARVVATPGHMPGHLAVFVEEDGLLIAGDSLIADQGRLLMANPRYTLDMAGARESVRRLLDLPIQRVLCFHGGLVEGDVRKAMLEMLEA